MSFLQGSVDLQAYNLRRTMGGNMSKVMESIRVKHSIEDVRHAIRSAALRTVSPLNEIDDVFLIKFKMKRSLLSSGVPASVRIELSPSKKIENATVIKFTSSNIGIGPLQTRECQSKLNAVKEAILADLEVLQQLAEAEEKRSLKVGNKTFKRKKLRRKKYKLTNK